MNPRYRIISFVLLLAFCVGTRAGNVVTLSSVTGSPEEEVTVSVSLRNDDPVSSLQLLIPIDDNVSLVDGSGLLGSRCTNHSVGVGVKDGCVSVFVYSLSMAAFADVDGEVASFKLKLGNQPGVMKLNPSKVVAIGPDGKETACEAENGEVKTACAKAVLSTLKIDYGRVPIKSTYRKRFQVKNEGNEDLRISQVVFSDVNVLSTTSQLPMTVKPGNTQPIEVVYTPTERGTVSNYVKLVSNSVSKLNTVTLSAAPYAVNEIQFQSTSGISDEVVPVVMKMNNMDPISGMQFEMELPSDLEYVDGSFSLSERKEDHTSIATMVDKKLLILSYSPTDKPFKGNDGEICSFRVKLRGKNSVWFRPSNVVLSATIDNKVENVVSGYNGMSIGVKAPIISVPSTLDFGAVPITENAEKELTISNSGDVPLTISKVVSDNESLYVKEEMPLVIDGKQSKTITVAYSGMEEAPFTGRLSIYNNDPSNRVVDVTVSGSRFAPNYLDVTCPKLFPEDSLHIDVSVNTYDAISGIQFDLEYPSDMFEPFEDNYTVYDKAIGMTVTSREIGDGKLRYFCYFISGTGVPPYAGKIMTIHMRPKSESTPEGTYAMNVSNIILGTTDLTDKYTGEDVSVPVVVMPGFVEIKLPDVSFEFNYNACEYNEVTHSIPNHKEAMLNDNNLCLTGNIPVYDSREGCLLIKNICRGWIDRWEMESPQSGSYFYRSGSDDMTIICKVAPDLNLPLCDLIANSGGDDNYVLRVNGLHDCFYLYTGTEYQESGSVSLASDKEQVLAVRVNGSENYILLDNLTTGESVKMNGVGWGESSNAFKFFYNSNREYFQGKFFWSYYSKECLEDEELAAVMAYNDDFLPTYVPVESITLDRTECMLTLNEAIKLSPTVAPLNASPTKLLWHSDNEDVVSVSSRGVVTTRGEGSASIVVHDVLTGIEAKCTIFVVPSAVSESINLVEGWNWVSLFVDSPLPVDKLSPVERVMTQTEENYLDPELGMVGNIDELTVGRAYKIKSGAAVSAALNGHLHDFTANPITLQKGWNWISYPYYMGRALTTVISNAEEGDIIVSQTGFAEYSDGVWQGTLDRLSSGAGYLYKASSEKNLMLSFADESSASMVRESEDGMTLGSDVASHAVDIHKYPSTMNIIAILDGDGKGSMDDYVVHAFVGDECRGTGRVISGRYFITIYGDAPESVKFLLRNNRTGEVCYAGVTLTFHENVIGSMKKPYLLTLTPTGISNVIASPKGYKVYSIEGILIGDDVSAESLKQLPKGVYIINGKKMVIEK